MSIRTPRERLLQTLCFEAGGLLIAAPLYAAAFGRASANSFLLILAVSVAVMLWSPLHNTAFDRAELALAGRVASDRPHGWRILHAISHEVSAVAVSLPLIMSLGGHDIGQALTVNLGLTAFYTAYSYVFHCAFDSLRPVIAPVPVRVSPQHVTLRPPRAKAG